MENPEETEQKTLSPSTIEVQLFANEIPMIVLSCHIVTSH